MDTYDHWNTLVASAAKDFLSLDISSKVLVIAHFDADGISAAAILKNLFTAIKREHRIIIVPQITEEKIASLKQEKEEIIMFADLGSSHMKSIKEHLQEKKVFILDHHKPNEEKAENIMQLNPHLCALDGSKEISGAGVAYFFSKALAKECKKKISNLPHIAFVGIIGDAQNKKALQPLNKIILDDAIAEKKLCIKKGINIFGKQTRPLPRLLAKSNDIVIPGVTGSEQDAVEFIKSLGIKTTRADGKWKKLQELTEEEKEKLIVAIREKRKATENPDAFLGDNFILLEEDKISPTRDANEFATLLNACGRLGKYDLGLRLCTKDASTEEAQTTVSEYKYTLTKAMQWFNSEKNKKESETIKEEQGVTIINAKNKVKATIIGTVASILTRSHAYPVGTCVMALARTEHNQTKVSLRRVESKQTRKSAQSQQENKDIDLREVIKNITKEIPAEFGGHKRAAGAIISTDQEEAFIKAATEALKQ